MVSIGKYSTELAWLSFFCKQEGRCYGLDVDSLSKVHVLKSCSWLLMIGRGGGCGLSVEGISGVP